MLGSFHRAIAFRPVAVICIQRLPDGVLDDVAAGHRLGAQGRWKRRDVIEGETAG
jgi:hypothetical protein